MPRKSSDQTVAHPGSFRDPAGFIYSRNETLYRQINKSGAKDYDLFMSSGFYEELVAKKLLIPHLEVSTILSLHAKKHIRLFSRPLFRLFRTRTNGRFLSLRTPLSLRWKCKNWRSLTE